MSTAATPTPIARPSTETQRALRTLPENWRQVALASDEKKAKGIRALAAALAMRVDGEDAIAPVGRNGEPNVNLTVADVKYGAGYHSRERAEYIIDNSPSTVRDIFSGADPRKLRTIYDDLKAKKSLGKHEEPRLAVRETATVFELKYELYELLTNDDLEKVLKYALARLHPDNKETGNETKYKRLGEIWGKIKAIEGV
jgi:hypothetical protein